MKNSRRFFFAGVMSLVVLTLAACGFGKSGNRDLEAAFPKDGAMIFVVDYTSDKQAANLERMINQFPTTGLIGMYKKLFNGSLKAANLSWEEDLVPIFKGKWKAGISVTSGDLGEMIFAGKFEESSKISVLIGKLIASGEGFWKDVKYEKDDGVEYWTNDSGSVYLALSRDIFVIGKSGDDRKAAMKRIAKNDGLNKNQEFKDYVSKSEGRIFYMFQSGTLFNSGIGKVFGEKYAEVLQALKSTFAEMVMVEDGLRSYYGSSIDENNPGFSVLVPSPNYKISLVDKVNSKGLFYYSESVGFMSILLDSLVEKEPSVSPDEAEASVQSGFLQTSVLGGLGIEPGEKATADSSGGLKELISSFVQKIKFLLDSPHAISISDRENFLPAIAFYFQLQDDDLEKAKNLLVDFDGYVDEIILEVNKLIPAIEGQTSFMKKDIAAVNGGALHKVFVDWKSVPQDSIAEWSMLSGIDVTSVKNEFYYGLMGDGVFVVAWYPDFPTFYGQNVLSQDADYKEAFGQLKNNYDRSVSYLNTKPLVIFMDKFLKMAVTMNTTDGLGQDIALGYVKLAEKFIGTVKYFVASSGYEDGHLSSESFVRIEKVEDEDGVK